jgi:hypothetical protein
VSAARVWNTALAFAYVVQGICIAHNWYAGVPADWFVWSAAIYACAVLSVWCVRDAIRGEW